VKIQVDPQTVFPRPTESFQHVSPSDSTKERLSLVSFDSPPSERNSNPVESGSCDLSEIFLSLFRRDSLVNFSFWGIGKSMSETHNESLIMLSHSVGQV
jgi:hypothetical protein